MKNVLKKIIVLLAMIIAFGGFSLVAYASTAGAEQVTEVSTEVEVEEETTDNTTFPKAIAAGLAIGLAAIGGTFGMSMAVSKSVDGISRQPEAAGKIQTAMMLGLVFVETVIIYALVVAILIIFVL